MVERAESGRNTGNISGIRGDRDSDPEGARQNASNNNFIRGVAVILEGWEYYVERPLVHAVELVDNTKLLNTSWCRQQEVITIGLVIDQLFPKM